MTTADQVNQHLTERCKVVEGWRWEVSCSPDGNMVTGVTIDYLPTGAHMHIYGACADAPGMIKEVDKSIDKAASAS